MSAVGAFSGKSKDAARNAGLVAFASDDTTARDLLQFFEQLGESDVYVGRGGIDAVIDHLGRVETSPKRLVVDISGIDQPLAALDRLADACDPSVQVYVLGDKNDVTLYRALLQAGVRDYRYKPMTAEALRSWVDDQDGSLVRRSRTGKIIAVTGTRGGVGTTTVATRLAAQLTEGKGLRRVVYIDLDVYGSAGSTLLGMTAANHALTEVMQNIDRIDPQFLERTLTTQDGRLFVLAAGQAYPDDFAPEPDTVRQLLEVLAQHFHYVIIDLHESGGAIANQIFSEAQIACVLSDRSVHSARTLERLILHIQSRVSAPALHIVLNTPRAPARGQIGSAEFTKAVSHPIALEIPYDGRHPGLAEDLGEPLAKGSLLAKAVDRLARMLTGELKPGTAHAGGRSWFRRSA